MSEQFQPQMTLSQQFVGKLVKHHLLPTRPFLSIFYYHNSSSNKHRRKLEKIFLTNMPKSQGPTTNKDKLRHVRYREQIGGKLPVPGKIELQVIGSGGRGTPRSIILQTEHLRYLFNCGEGTQRIATEHKIKLSRLENIFITHNSWDNIGGLLGLALTVEGISVPKITIHGPALVEQTIRMAKAFAESSNIQIDKREVELGTYVDAAFQIEYVPIHRANFTSTVNSTARKPAKSMKSFTHNNNTKNAADNDKVPAKKRRLSQEELCSAVAYICKPHSAKRRLLLEKCVDLGVPVGPLLGALKNEESVTLDDGTVVTPDQVLSTAETPYPIIILECPSVDYLDSLVNSKQLNSLQKSGEKDFPAELVVHMTPVEVMDHPKYQQWIQSFPSETEHLILNEATSGIANIGLFKIQTMLNLLSPSIFPLLHHQKLELQKDNVNSTENGVKTKEERTNHMQLACTNLKYHIRPRKGYNRDHCIHLDNEEYVKEAYIIPEFKEQLQNFHTKVCEHIKEQDPDAVKYPRIVFLGTGSSVPSKRRNVSGILLQTEPNSYILLDCGEGTAGQLYRHYGDEATANILRNLKAIFISHMHADHHMGLFGILLDRAKVMSKNGEIPSPVLLLSPIQINRWLNFYANNIEDIQDFIHLVPLQKIMQQQLDKNAALYSDVLKKLNLVEFVPVEVNHCKNAFGVCLAHSSNWKIVYSGDTMPCHRLVTAGKNCDLLIHEATMEDDLEEEAKIKTHSTTSQAINIGMQMEAKFILLNHFSQRYSKIPIISDTFSENVGISFDNMSLSTSDLPLLPHLNEPLKTLFAEEYAEMEEKILKRTLRKQLQEADNSSQQSNISKQTAFSSTS